MDVFEAINDGLHDDDLQKIIDACKKRLRSAPIEVGQTVKVSDNCSPKYMQGVLCKVISVHGTKQKTGETVYLCEPLESEVWKLMRTKMVSYSYGETKASRIRMMRSLIEPVIS